MTTKCSVLHIDDNPVFTNLTKILFDDLGVKYKAVRDTQDAFKSLENNRPDLLIVDLMLENDWDTSPGVQFIKKVHEKYKDLKMMVLSARSDESLRNKLKEYIVHYETKSFSPSSFKKNMSLMLLGTEG